jgi:hypothetical protein
MPIVMTSFLVDLVFLVPISSGEKITYILTEFLALLVLLTIVIPPTSITVSVLGKYSSLTLKAACLQISQVISKKMCQGLKKNKKIQDSSNNLHVVCDR